MKSAAKQVCFGRLSERQISSVTAAVIFQWRPFYFDSPSAGFAKINCGLCVVVLITDEWSVSKSVIDYRSIEIIDESSTYYTWPTCVNSKL